jgi:hypothetical protein
MDCERDGLQPVKRSRVGARIKANPLPKCHVNDLLFVQSTNSDHRVSKDVADLRCWGLLASMFHDSQAWRDLARRRFSGYRPCYRLEQQRSGLHLSSSYQVTICFEPAPSHLKHFENRSIVDPNPNALLPCG